MRPANYTENPAVMALDVREYLVGQRNLAEGALLHLEAALAKWADGNGEPEAYAEKARRDLRRDIAISKHELRLLKRRVADMDAIYAALTRPPEPEPS